MVPSAHSLLILIGWLMTTQRCQSARSRVCACLCTTFLQSCTISSSPAIASFSSIRTCFNTLALGLVGDDAFDGAVKSRNHFAGLRQDENTPESAGSLPGALGGAGFGELSQQQLLAIRGVGGVRSRVTGRVDSRSPVERLHSGLNITTRVHGCQDSERAQAARFVQLVMGELIGYKPATVILFEASAGCVFLIKTGRLKCSRIDHQTSDGLSMLCSSLDQPKVWNRQTMQQSVLRKLEKVAGDETCMCNY
jgi:hypothetical protein